MWNEWSDKLDRLCDSHDEASLIMLNEPLERLVSCPRTGAVGGTCQSTHVAHAPNGAPFNKDNPHTGRQAQASVTHVTPDGD